MIIEVAADCSEADVEQLAELARGMGATLRVISGAGRTIIELLGTNGTVNRSAFERSGAVKRIFDCAEPLLAARRFAGERPGEVPLGNGSCVGGRRLAVIAGPCSVESNNQLLETAAAVKEAGAVGLRCGVFKPRTAPYCFQGLGKRGLEMAARAREATGLAIVTEAMSVEQVATVGPYANVLQVGSRNMQNTPLLEALGRQRKPVLLKRGWSATLDELLLAAEYILLGGNPQVILCERGIRTHETYVRNTLALAAVPQLKLLSPLPVIVDPSHEPVAGTWSHR